MPGRGKRFDLGKRKNPADANPQETLEDRKLRPHRELQATPANRCRPTENADPIDARHAEVAMPPQQHRRG